MGTKCMLTVGGCGYKCFRPAAREKVFSTTMHPFFLGREQMCAEFS